MAYLNTTSGLNGFLDNLTQSFDQQAQNNDQLRGLAAGGIVPANAAPGPSVLSRLLSSVGLGPSAQATQVAPPGAMPASAAPQAAVGVPNMPQQRPAPQMASAPAYSPPPAGPLPSFAAAGAPNGGDNASRALAFYQAKGLSPVAAAALVGGFQGESGRGLSTTALNRGDGSDGSNSIGIAQWNGPRAQGLHQFAAANGLDPSNIDTQLQYSWLELNGPEKGTLQALQSASDPAKATAAALGYERPEGWTAQNPYGAKSFGSRLQKTIGLASNGFSAPFNGQPVGPNPNAFTPNPTQTAASPYGDLSGSPFMARAGQGQLPTIAASGMAALMPNATGFSRPPQQSGPAMASSAAPQSAPMAFSPQGQDAPAAQAIAAAAPGTDPLVSVPGYQGQWNKARIAAAPDGTDVPDDGELAKAQTVAVALPATGPGTAVAQSPAAPQLASPPAAPGQFQRPSLAQVQALVQNPATRQLGLQLWQGFLQKNDPYTLSAGQQRYSGDNQLVASAPTNDRTETARPLTADEKAAYGLPADGAFEMQAGKVFAVPGTYDPRGGGGARNHVVGDALVDDKGQVLYQKPTTNFSDPELVESLARRVYSGDTTALIGLGRGAAGASLLGAIQKRAGELAQQYKGQPLPDFAEADILRNRADQIGEQAGARASGTLNARLDTYAKEASGAMDLAVQASRQVPRTTWTPVNLAVQAIQRGANDPKLAALVAANNAVINTYAKAINPNGVPTVSDKTHASEVLSSAQSAEAYEATIAQLQREINIAHNAARGARAAERSGEAAKDMPVNDTGTGAPGSTSQGIVSTIKHAIGLDGGTQSDQPVPVQSPADAARLRSGTKIALPDGRIGTVP